MQSTSKYLYLLPALLSMLPATSCKQEADTLFVQAADAHTHILFENTLQETPELNVMEYEYLYNGGGIAAGDFNNDGLCDLYFTGNMVENKLYLNAGNLQFEDVTRQAGVAGRSKWKTGVTTADVNADGWLDIYVCYSGPVSAPERANELYINNGAANGAVPTFTESAVAYGLDATGTFSIHASFFDYDLDGDLDMFLLNHGNRFYGPFFNTRKLRSTRHPQFGNRLYRNDGSLNAMPAKEADKPVFTEVSDSAGINGGGLNFGLSVSVSDVNNDGWPDVYVTNDYEEQDFLYINNKNGTFTESTKQSMGHISRYGMGSDIADFNNDALTDILVVDMLPEDNHRQKMLKGPDEYNKYQLMVDSGYHHQNMRNTLQLNQGISPEGYPVFSEIGQLAGVSNTDWSWAPLLADYDNDGWKDLFITNGYLRDFTNMDFLKYVVEDAKAKALRTGTSLPIYELIKQMPSTKISNYVFKNNGNLTFSNKTQEWGMHDPVMSSGAVYADLDNDGDLDIVTNNSNQKATLWQNKAENISQNNYLKIKLKGNGKNRLAMGAKVYIETAAGKQMQELVLSRGYQSAVEPVLLFGIGKTSIIKQVKVVWPGGKITTKTQVQPNQLLELSQSESAEVIENTVRQSSTFFSDISRQSGIDFAHQENKFVDFQHEHLIPYQLSRLGPHLTQADVNEDGLEDFFVGGAAGQSGKLYLMNSGGNFRPAPQQPWSRDAACEDVGVLFFDADSDSDQDLYVVSGGNEFLVGSPQLTDRLYLNLGNGTFTKAPTGMIPDEYTSGSCVAAADYDKDGDIDLFVGGRTKPGSYPVSSPGGILRNDRNPQTGQTVFTVATSEVNALLREPGMVTDALWTDFNGDTWPDLMLVGEWMPVLLFENQKGKLIKLSGQDLEKTNGLWNKILGDDFDNDGDTDYVLGNLGTNTQWKASASEPLTLYYHDFDTNGHIDPIICSYVQGKLYPIASRDEIIEQIPSLKKKFVKYAQYADAGIADIFHPDSLKKAKKLLVHTLQSAYLENAGSRFIMKPLPVEAQFSMVCGLLSHDYNQDGHKDILLSGNFYPLRAQYGKADASMGLVLKGDGKGNFTPLSWPLTGFYAPGDIRDMIRLKSPHYKQTFIIGKNNSSVQVMMQTFHEHSEQ